MKSNIHDLIISYLCGNISEPDRQTLTNWINEDEQHWREFQRIKNIWVTTHPPFSPDTIDTEKAFKNVIHAINKRKWYNRRFIITLERIAAILILPLLIAYLYNLNSHERINEFIAYQEVFCPFGSKTELMLPDSSKVWLNSGSSIKYPVSFTSKERTVTLEGEAFFEVQSDAQHPFIVSIGNAMHVTATGTAFNVEAYETDSIVAVTMVDGKVHVGMNTTPAMPLTAGERIIFNKESSIVRKSKTSPSKWCSWKDGTLIFRDDPLSEVFKRLGRIYNVDIVIKDKVIARQLYRATFEEESFDEILELLKLSAPIGYRKIKLSDPNHLYQGKQRIEVYRITK